MIIVPRIDTANWRQEISHDGQQPFLKRLGDRVTEAEANAV